MRNEVDYGGYASDTYTCEPFTPFSTDLRLCIFNHGYATLLIFTASNSYRSIYSNIHTLDYIPLILCMYVLDPLNGRSATQNGVDR